MSETGTISDIKAGAATHGVTLHSLHQKPELSRDAKALLRLLRHGPIRFHDCIEITTSATAFESIIRDLGIAGKNIERIRHPLAPVYADANGFIYSLVKASTKKRSSLNGRKTLR